MKKVLLLFVLLTALAFQSEAQRKPMESSLLVGYQKYFPVYPLGMFQLGYTGFFEHEGLTHFTRRTRFTANAMFNPMRSMYGLQVGGSYSYLFAAGFNFNLMREFPLVERTWLGNLNPFVGLDFWFFSFHVGYNVQIELNPPLAAPPPSVGRLNFTLNAYIPLRRNKSMYR